MDINALRERLANINKKTTKSTDLFKPKDEHVFRCVPYPHGPESIIELQFHGNIGDNFPILCPKCNFGDECAICDFADALRSFNDADGRKKSDTAKKTDWELFRKIQATPRYYVAGVERAHESELAKFWGLTSNQCKQLLDVCSDGDRLEELGIDKDDVKNAHKVLFDPVKGYDVQISYAKPGDKGNTSDFTRVTVKGKIKPTSLSKDMQESKKILDSVKKINDVFPKVSSAEIKKLLDKWVGAGGPEAKPEGGGEKYEKKPAATNSKENANKVGGKSIDDAFKDLAEE